MVIIQRKQGWINKSGNGIVIEMPSSTRTPAVDAGNEKGAGGGRHEYGSYYFEDHFWGREALVIWTTRVTTGTFPDTPASDLNGQVRLTTGATGTDEESVDWDDVLECDNTLRPTLEVRVNLAQVDDDTNIFIGLVNTNIGTDFSKDLGVGNEDLIGFQMSHTIYTSTNWNLHCQLDGVSTSDAGAAAAASTDVVLRFEFTSDTAVEWFINGTSQGTIDANIPTDALQPVIYIMTDAAAAKSIDVDYIKIWQDKT